MGVLCSISLYSHTMSQPYRLNHAFLSFNFERIVLTLLIVTERKKLCMMWGNLFQRKNDNGKPNILSIQRPYYRLMKFNLW